MGKRSAIKTAAPVATSINPLDIDPAPAHLPEPAREIWILVVTDLVDRGAWHIRLRPLVETLALAQYRVREAQAVIARDGMTTMTPKGGLAAHPLIAASTQLMTRIAQISAQLGIDLRSTASATATTSSAPAKAKGESPWD